MTELYAEILPESPGRFLWSSRRSGWTFCSCETQDPVSALESEPSPRPTYSHS